MFDTNTYRQTEQFRREQIDVAERRRAIREATQGDYKPEHKDDLFRLRELAR